MTSGRIDNWRSEPGRWSHRIIKSRRKNGESLRRTKSVDGSTELDAIHEAPLEAEEDVKVEVESIEEEPSIDETQVRTLNPRCTNFFLFN